MNREKTATIVLLAVGAGGILYYLASRKKAAAPGAGGPNANAGGAPISRAVASDSAGVSGSIPSIIASAAALTGKSFGSIFQSTERQAGTAPKTIDQSSSAITGSLQAPIFAAPSPILNLQPSTPSGSTFVSLGGGVGGGSAESTGTVSLPGLGALSPDIPSFVSALDVGGIDYGTLYA